MSLESLDSIVYQDKVSDISAIEAKIAELVQARIQSKKPILALTILMESFRPADIGAYTDKSDSITPFFDKLTESGIFFANAYATGGVTRTGQEAGWCGYPGGQETSTMRGREDVKISCLPKEVISKNGEKTHTSWIHGGDGGFDGQKNYWFRQGVKELTSRDSFPVHIARTGWGVGDITVFDFASDRYAKDNLDGRITFSMLLSVSNHIPWVLPGDAPTDASFLSLKAKIHDKHRAFTTTAYSDAALGRLTDSMKKNGTWSNAIIVVASDHGTLEDTHRPTPNADPTNAEVTAAEKLSHIALLITGGLVEEALKESGEIANTTKRENSYVSQAGVAQFWSVVFDLKSRLIASSILAQSRFPVIADLGHALYLPASKTVISKEDLSSLIIPSTYSIEAQRAILYHRAFIHKINAQGLQPAR